MDRTEAGTEPATCSRRRPDIKGGEVNAVKHDPLEGKGDLRLVMKEDDTFEVIFDGWLLHRVVEEEEEGEDR